MKAKDLALRDPVRGTWVPYLLALVFIWVATVLRFPFQHLLGNTNPFLFYFPVVLIMASAFGLRAGLLATIASVLPANYFWMFPEGTLSINLIQGCQMLAFSVAGCSVSWLSEEARKRKQVEEHLRSTIANMADGVITADREGKIVYLNTLARVMTELEDEDAVGYTIGSALDLEHEGRGIPMNAEFQIAINEDEIERLPRRMIIISKSGKRQLVEQRTSRILDARGRRLGVAIQLHSPSFMENTGRNRRPEKIEDILNPKSALPRIAMVSTHGYVAVNPPLGAADTGGQVVYVLEVSKKLAQLGYEVDIWTRRFEDQPEIESLAERVRIIRVPAGGEKFIPKEYLFEALPQWSENALRFIAQNHLQYRFINSHYWDAGVAAKLLSKTLGIPHVHTPHSLGIWKKRQMEADFPGDAAHFEKRYNLNTRILHEREIYASAEIIVATTPQQLQILQDDYAVPKSKCHMIPPGYDDNRFYPVGDPARQVIRNRLGFKSPVVQTIGRLAHNKGYELLIQAFQLVAKRVPEAVLHLAVGGENLTAREQGVLNGLKARVNELGLSDKVRFDNFIPEDQLADHYRAADVFVLPSRYEPFGMTAVEAMACGTPTVVTVHGGLHQAVTFGQEGLYADPFDPEDLAIMIAKILKHPRLRSRLSRMGSRKARAMFTWTGVAQEFVALAEHRALESPVSSEASGDGHWHSVD